MKSHTQNAQGGSGPAGHRFQQKAAAAIDRRSRFQKSPTVFLAAALGGGLLIGIATNDRKPRLPPERTHELEAPPNRRRLSWDWNDSIGVIKSVLIAIAITQGKKMLTNRMPPASGPANVAPDSAMH
jgi:hypothetical protein